MRLLHITDLPLLAIRYTCFGDRIVGDGIFRCDVVWRGYAGDQQFSHFEIHTHFLPSRQGKIAVWQGMGDDSSDPEVDRFASDNRTFAGILYLAAEFYKVCGVHGLRQDFRYLRVQPAERWQVRIFQIAPCTGCFVEKFC